MACGYGIKKFYMSFEGVCVGEEGDGDLAPSTHAHRFSYSRGRGVLQEGFSEDTQVNIVEPAW